MSLLKALLSSRNDENNPSKLGRRASQFPSFSDFSMGAEADTLAHGSEGGDASHHSTSALSQSQPAAAEAGGPVTPPPPARHRASTGSRPGDLPPSLAHCHTLPKPLPPRRSFELPWRAASGHLFWPASASVPADPAPIHAASENAARSLPNKPQQPEPQHKHQQQQQQLQAEEAASPRGTAPSPSEPASPTGSQAGTPTGSPTAPQPIPFPAAAGGGAAAAAAAAAERGVDGGYERPARPRHKIDGLEYYEFCELIRSSSL